MTKDREKAIKLYWKIAKERCPFHEEEKVYSFLEGFIDCAEYLLLQNTGLEKENVELKNRNSELAGQKASLERWYGEAKEILTKLLEEEKNNMYWVMNGSDKSSYYEVRKQAEQFLKEE